MLFDPAEEEFNLPAGAIELRDGESGQQEVVGKADQSRVFFGIEEVDAA